MAQADYFQNFLGDRGSQLDNALRAGVITLRERRDIEAEIYQQEMNILSTRKSLLKSDTKSLNVLKKISNVHGKVIGQITKTRDLNKSIGQTEANLKDLKSDILKQTLKYRKAQQAGNTQEAEALMRQIGLRKQMYNRAALMNEQAKIGLAQMRKTIPILGNISAKGGKWGAAADFVMDSFGGIASTFKTILEYGTVFLATLFEIGKAIFNTIMVPIKKTFNLFLQIQSTTGKIAADIGLTHEESHGLLMNMSNLAMEALRFGGTMEDVAATMIGFSQATGKNRIFDEREIGQLVELGLGTSLGAQGAADIAASFDNIGISLEKTINLTDKARGLAARYNINSGKLLTTYNELVKSLTGIGFGKGLDNLTKLAAKAQAIRFDIAASTKAFSDAFFDPEKAVEAAAQMQVLGGKFAQSFGDPMQLAFESMTDPSALAEKFANTLQGIVAKDKNGNYFIPPADRKMLKLAAEQMGQSYEDAVGSAIKQKEMLDKMDALRKSGFNMMQISDDDKPALANLMKLNEHGQYVIKNSAGVDELLANMTDKNQLNAILDSRRKNEKAAIERKNLAERLTMIADRFMLGFSSVMTKLFGGSDFDSFLNHVENVGTDLAKFIQKDLLGNKGIAETFKSVLDKGRDTFDKIVKIFENPQGSLLQHMGQAMKTLVADFAKPMVKQIIDTVMPFLKAALAEIISVIGDMMPFGMGGTLHRKANDLRASAISSSGSLKELYGGDAGQQAIQNQVKAGAPYEDKHTMTDAALKGYKGYSKIGMNKMMNMTASKFGQKYLGKEAAKVGAKSIAKHIPILGTLVSLGFAIKDLTEGDFAGAGLQALSGVAGLADMVVPGLGTGLSIGIDGLDAAREMGAFEDGVIYKDGSYAKFGKGDMVNFIDQSAYERAMNGMNTGAGGGKQVVEHVGTIRIESNDGKVVTWEQMFNARDMIGGRIASINKSYEGGFGDFQDGNISPIKPLM